jgi:alanyl-tRNA synthetase
LAIFIVYMNENNQTNLAKKNLTANELRSKFLDFYKSKGHAILESSSLVPKEDPTVLFNTAGMQPLVPYLTGKTHPEGSKLANSQKCLRTDDIDEIGDNRHLSYFEMLGSWSLGDYFKQDSIKWGFEFLTSKDWLGLDPKRLYTTVYKGSPDGQVPADLEASKTWKGVFIEAGLPEELVTEGVEYNFKNPNENLKDGGKFVYRITQRSGKDNWWGLPYKGPCGPCSEIYYLLDSVPLDFEKSILPNLPIEEVEEWLDSNIVEIWNHVFMEYIGTKGPDKEPLELEVSEQKNIDTGMGFERVLAIINGHETVFETDVLKPIVSVVEKFIKP